jgi:hypothetical protein
MSQIAMAHGFHGSGPGAAPRRPAASNSNAARLDPARRSVDYGVRYVMRFSTRVFACLCLFAGVLLAGDVAAQNSPASAPKPQSPPPATNVQTRITVEVTGGDKNVPVENASVYVKFVEEHAIRKNKKLEINVKTSREGIAHVPDAPMGRALVQVVAEGWKTYGHWMDITDPKQTIKVHLERPPKWY